MSAYRCHACDVQYRSGSFVPGRVDVCLNCAAENPCLVSDKTLFMYRLTRRGTEVTSEIVCERHYAQMATNAGPMAPLSEKEIDRAGYKQTVRPYSGVYPCATCEADAEEMKERQAADAMHAERKAS